MKEDYVIKELNKAGIQLLTHARGQGRSSLSVDTVGRDFSVDSLNGEVVTIKSFQGDLGEYPETVEKFTTCKALIAAIEREVGSRKETKSIDQEEKDIIEPAVKERGLDISEDSLRSMIINLPGRPPAMLAPALAEIYGVTTGNLNKAVARNSERFPEEFMFHATDQELRDLKFQIGILHSPRCNPYLFTKEGSNQLSAVLTSETAVLRSIQIIKAFTAIEQKASAPALPQSLPEALRLAASIEEKRLALEEKVKADAPAVEYAKAVEDTTGAIKISIFAKQLNNAGIKTGPNKLFAWLRSEKYLITSVDKTINNNPYQDYVNSGLFVLKQGWYLRTDRLGIEEKVQCNTTLITGKGQLVITGKLIKIRDGAEALQLK